MTGKKKTTLDCSGHLCPAPILMTEERIAALSRGEMLEVIYTDPGAGPDLAAWCKMTGNEWLGARAGKNRQTACIRKK